MDSIEIAWAAGLIEGEGTVCVKGSGGLYVGVSMTDEDVVRKIHSIAGIGTVNMCKKKENRKQVWVWRAGKRSEVIAFIKKIRPYMGARRTSAIDKVFAHDMEHPQWRVPKGELVHGIRSGYKKGCRCKLCKKAESVYNKDLRERRETGNVRNKGNSIKTVVQRVIV